MVLGDIIPINTQTGKLGSHILPFGRNDKRHNGGLCVRCCPQEGTALGRVQPLYERQITTAVLFPRRKKRRYLVAVGGVVIDANCLQMHHVNRNLADSVCAVNENTLDTIALADLSMKPSYALVS